MLGTIMPPIWNYFHKSIRILTTQDDQLDKNLINKNLISKFFLVFQEFLGLYKTTLVFLSDGQTRNPDKFEWLNYKAND